MSLYGMFRGKGATGFGHNSTTDEVTEGLDLSGKTYLVTGCNSGIGGDTLRILTERGARVIGAARTIEKADAACEAAPGEAVGVACELSEPSSVLAAVRAVKDLGFELDGILCNAGIMALPTRTLLHGYEAQWFTNHVGHFILVTGLLDQLSAGGRVVMTSSYGHTMTYAEGIRLDDLSADQGYDQWRAYGQSKLSNILFANHLATLLKPGQTANSVHPGVIITKLTRHMPSFVEGMYAALGPAVFTKSLAQGAATQVYVAVHPDAAKYNGKYFADCNLKTPSGHGSDAKLAAALWKRTEEVVAGLT